MDATSPLDPLDPNVPSRPSVGKSQLTQKPLPLPPSQPSRERSQAPQTDHAAVVSSSPSHVGRPSLSTAPSYQRPRKRVLWRNKACIIALPLESELGKKTNRESYLAPEEVVRRLHEWESHGFDTKGFVLESLSAATAPDTAQGQSRAIHPDPEDEKEERSSHLYRVNIPNRREWEAYVDQLKEQKLRALGVSSGDDELSSKKSPAPSLMSRQASSQSSAVLTSPSLLPSSVHAISFPPSMQQGNLPANPAVSHFPRYSMAVPFGEKPFSPPNQFQLSRSPVHVSWSPQPYLSSQPGGSRVASPAIAGQSFNLDGRLSPAPPPLNPNIHHVSTQQDPSDPLARMRQQESLLQAQYRKQQLQEQNTPQSHPQYHGVNVKVHPAVGDARLDIATPVPQHRQNHSESLQREVDEAEAYDEMSKRQDEETQGQSSSEKIEGTENAVILTKETLTESVSQSDPTTKLVKKPDEHRDLVHSTPTKHDSTIAGSKFNANAPEFKFEPQKAITTDIFSFLGNQQIGSLAQNTPAISTRPLPQSRRISNSPSQATKFNVAAPVFTPSTAPRPLVPSREFSFSSTIPSFRPDAPTFTPNGMKKVADSDGDKEHPVEAVKKIFGDINFSEAIKSAKGSLAVPVTKPDKTTDVVDHEMEGQEDESGRITQADGRQKRMRHEHDNGDSVPLFASQSSEPWMNRGEDERAAYFSRTQSPVSDRGRTSTLEAATDLLEGLLDEMPASEVSSLLREDSPDRASSRRFEEYSYHDIDRVSEPDNQSLDSLRARPNGSTGPAPEEVAKATQDFLKKSSQYQSEFDQALDCVNSQSPSDSTRSDSDRRLLKGDCIDRIDHASGPSPLRQDVLDAIRYVEPHEPSYHELDAVIKQLNQEGDSDFGIERSPSPWQRQSPRSNVGHSPRPVQIESAISHKLMPPTNIRSDAPSPSPNRLREPFQYLPPTDTESADSAAVELIARNARHSPSYRPSRASPSVHRLNSPGDAPQSDWDDAISSLEEDKLKSRTGFFDSRVNDVVGGIVQKQLGPLERTLFDIKQSLYNMPNRAVSRTTSRRPRSSGALEIEHSDADDEDDIAQHSQARLKSPLRDRKYDQLKSTLNEVTAAQHNFAQASQLVEVMNALNELKSSVQQTSPANTVPTDIKTIIEDAVGRQMRGRSAPVTSTSQAAATEKSQLHIAGLESMLKIAENRAEDELQARRATEDALADNQRLLRAALQDAAEQRESAEETERSLHEYHAERQQSLKHMAILEGSHQSLEKTASDISDKNEALEGTLAEYRLSHDQWRTDIDNERHENKELRRIMASLKTELEESHHERHNLQVKFNELQEKTISASREIASDRLRWCSKEEEHINRLEMLSARLEAEARTRERLEHEIERLESQEKESMKARISVEQTQKANAHLDKLIGQLKSESHEHQNAADRAQRDLHAAKETNIMENHRMRSALEVDVEAARSQVGNVRADLERVIEGLQMQLEDANQDAEKARLRHDQMLKEASESRHVALLEAADARENALQEHYRFHERSLGEVKSQHELQLNNAIEDKQRSETFFGNRLSLADEKIVHLQDRVGHLEEKLEIAKSAAHAAVQAAQAKKSAEPMSQHRASVPAKVSGIPEKISPQALRESIMVLQEQLQDRESRIEQLETRLSAVDTGAPTKLKDADIEITWLRELLGVRIDDLEDIITRLSQPSYNRDAVKDAAIRLKANLQMEQQEKERALAGGQAFPSLSSISNLASSPKALPLAAAAAWGNWRKGRDAGFGNLNAIADRSNSQTPSKPSPSPQSFFAGLMTPPNTNMRTTAQATTGSGPHSSLERASKGPSTPRQDVGSADQRAAPRSLPEPVTPPFMRKANYDVDANENGDLLTAMGQGDRQDGYAREEYEVGEEEEPFGPRIGTYSR